MDTGLINKFLPFSAVDGPGNRTVIFFQGCNLNCLYCHNPETINYCFNCGKCISGCKSNAIEFVNKEVVYNSSQCLNCDDCIKTCTKFSTPKAKKMSVNDVCNFIEKIKIFISGITISGGECTLQFDFLKSLLIETKRRNISTFIDTNAYLLPEKMIELSEYFDKAMIDIKWFDNSSHQKLTGKSNENILLNAEFLLKSKKVYEIRTVVFPNFADNENNIKNIAGFISKIDKSVIYKIINYRNSGVKNSEKFETINDNELTRFKQIAENEGCLNVKII